MRTIRRLYVIVLASVLFGGLHAGMEQAIVVSATARPDYVRSTDSNGSLKPETYVFSEGRFFGGTTQDGRLARTTFTDITQTLARSLAKQRYFPTRDVAGADLTIIVHWGTTTVYEDPLKEFNTADLNTALADYRTSQAQLGLADAGPVNQALDQLATTRDSTVSAINYNAVLLGYARTLKKERGHAMPTSAEWTLSMELNEERYFVILMAYDQQFMLKEHRPKLLWVTRLSIRSPGNNFTEALPALSQVGGQFFGHQLDGLARAKASWRDGQVILGELKVLGVAENVAPAKSDR